MNTLNCFMGYSTTLYHMHDEHTCVQSDMHMVIYDDHLYSGRAQPSTRSVMPVDAKNARDISLQWTKTHTAECSDFLCSLSSNGIIGIYSIF